MKKSIKSSSRSRIRTCTYSPKLNVQDVKTPINSEVNADSSEAELQQLMNDIKSAISTKLHRIMTSEEFGFEDSEVDDYSRVEVSSATIGEDDEETIRVEVRVELSYDGMLDVKEGLDPIVESYDSYAYFDFDEPGIMSAYVRVDQVDMSVYSSDDVLAGAYKQDDSIIIDAEDLRGKSREEIGEILKDAPVGSEIIHVRNTSNRFNIDTIIEKQQHYSSNYHQGFSSPHDWKTLNEFWAVGGREDPYIDKTIYEAVNGKNKYYGLTSDVLKAHGIDQPIDESTSVEASDSYHMNGDTYEYVDNVDGYWIYRAIVDGKGVWRAMPQGSDESQFDSLSFPISYDQARRFEPINEPSAITKLRKDLGKKLLPKAGQSVEATEDLSIYPEGFENAYTLAKNDFMNDYAASGVEIYLVPDDFNAEEGEICIIVKGINRVGRPTQGKVYVYLDEEDPDVIYQALDETADALSIERQSSDIEMSTCSDKEDVNAVDNPMSFRYKGRRIKLLTDGSGYAIYDAHGELEDSGFRTAQDAKEAIDEYDSIYQDPVTSSTDDKVFIEDIIDGLEDNGYDTNNLSSIKEGLWALFGYQGKDADNVIEDLVAGGFVDSNLLIDAGRTSVYSDTEQHVISGTEFYDHYLGDVVEYNGQTYVIIDDEDNLLTLRPKDRFGDNDFENPELGDSLEDIFLEPWQLCKQTP